MRERVSLLEHFPAFGGVSKKKWGLGGSYAGHQVVVSPWGLLLNEGSWGDFLVSRSSSAEAACLGSFLSSAILA